MKTHIQLPNSARHANAIVCGSPERAEWMASQLENSVPLAKNREYHSYIGKHEGKDILIVSHGVGSAGAAICFKELIDAGAKQVIRIGTAGGFYAGAKVGDIVLATAAVRCDGASSQMIYKEYPAVSDFALTERLRDKLAQSNVAHKTGIVLTTDLFYPGKIDSHYKLYSESNVLAVEMECATLFVSAQLAGVKAAGVFVLDGAPLDPGNYDPSPERLKDSLNLLFATAKSALIGE